MQGFKFYVPESISMVPHKHSPFISLEESGLYTIARFSEEEGSLEINGKLGQEHEALINFIIKYIQENCETKNNLRKLEFQSSSLLSYQYSDALVTALIFQIMHAWTYKLNDYKFWLDLLSMVYYEFNTHPSAIWSSFKGGVQQVSFPSPFIGNRWNFPSDWYLVMASDSFVKPYLPEYLITQLALNVSLLRQENVSKLLNAMSHESHILDEAINRDNYLIKHVFGGVFNNDIKSSLYFATNSIATDRLKEYTKNENISLKVFSFSKGTRRL